MSWRRLIQALLARYRAAVILGSAALVASVLALHGVGDGGPASERPSRVLLNRPWFDRYPESSSDAVSLYVWASSGIGTYQAGSAWRGSYDAFEFERRGNDLEMRFIQDGAEARTSFHVERCDDEPPFDVCLTLASSPRGPERYYSFDDDEDLAARLPWAADAVERARLVARSR